MIFESRNNFLGLNSLILSVVETGDWYCQILNLASFFRISFLLLIASFTLLFMLKHLFFDRAVKFSPTTRWTILIGRKTKAAVRFRLKCRSCAEPWLCPFNRSFTVRKSESNHLAYYEGVIIRRKTGTTMWDDADGTGRTVMIIVITRRWHWQCRQWSRRQR